MLAKRVDNREEPGTGTAMENGFSVDELLRVEVLSDAQISPAGDRVAYVVSENGSPKGARSPESRVWLVGVSGGGSRQVTFGPGTDSAPRWSPDGERLAFLSDREQRGTPQLYLLEGSPGEARKLTDLASGVSAYAWSPDGAWIAATSPDHMPESDDDTRLFDAERRFQRLYLVDVDSGSTSPVKHGDLHVWEFAFSPDGRAIAAIVSDEPFQWGWYEARLVRIDLESGDVITLYKSERQVARPAWSPDGTRIALISCRWSDPGMTGGDLLVVDATSGEMVNLTDGEPRSHLQAAWLPDRDAMVTVSWDRARAQVCEVPLEGGSRPQWTADCTFDDYAFSLSPTTGTLAAVLSSDDQTGQVWTGTCRDEGETMSMSRLTEPPAGAGSLPALESTWLSWSSADGRQIDGLYIYPGNRNATGEPPPMVTLVHGGPTGVASVGYRVAGPPAWIPLLRQRGIAVFLPNYRGSSGYGVEFAEANLGDLGGLDLQDVLTGVEHCVSEGLADGGRLGIGGWSYGGYLTALAIARSDRFSAAVAGASITNWYSFHGSTSIPAFASGYVGASPDDLDGAYARISPLFQSHRVRTPTLFLHGERDPVCPVGQAYEMYRALRRYGVDTECVVYPREPHGIGEREHRRDMFERGVRWFVTHLGES